MEKKIILLVEFIFYIVEHWGWLMVFIFTCAWGYRRQKFNFLHLRILTGKKHSQIKLQRLPKVQILAFGSLVHQVNSL